MSQHLSPSLMSTCASVTPVVGAIESVLYRAPRPWQPIHSLSFTCATVKTAGLGIERALWHVNIRQGINFCLGVVCSTKTPWLTQRERNTLTTDTVISASLKLWKLKCQRAFHELQTHLNNVKALLYKRRAQRQSKKKNTIKGRNKKKLYFVKVIQILMLTFRISKEYY